MKMTKLGGLCGLAFATALTTTQVFASDDKMYSVTITNLTRGESFTPILAITHKPGHPVFRLGASASPELVRIAEGGDTSMLSDKLLSSGMGYNAGNSEGLLGPGMSVTIMVSGNEMYDHLSVASMLLPTNDGFFAVNGIKLPKGKRVKTIMSPVYDAGSEHNDELCASIPGPQCGGEAFSAADGEGFVHIHGGIHGEGDLARSAHDWRNPAAKITVQRMSK